MLKKFNNYLWLHINNKDNELKNKTEIAIVKNNANNKDSEVKDNDTQIEDDFEFSF